MWRTHNQTSKPTQLLLGAFERCSIFEVRVCLDVPSSGGSDGRSRTPATSKTKSSKQ